MKMLFNGKILKDGSILFRDFLNVKEERKKEIYRMFNDKLNGVEKENLTCTDSGYKNSTMKDDFIK
jgi:hypothetical protein